MAPKRGQSFGAEVSFNAELRNCLVNLPGLLANAISDKEVKVQHVIVEIAWNTSATSQNGKTKRAVIGAGWTGMPSTKQQAAALDSKGKPGKAPEVLEIDANFARANSIENGQKIELLIHTNPPKAHTVQIEPATTADWEMIELHSEFLETHFLSQVRALPNPDFKPTGNDPASSHPLVLNLSPTSVAKVLVKSLKLESEIPNLPRHVRIEGADCEVHVAPKPRQRTETEARSVHSADDKNGAGSIRSRAGKTDTRPATFLRGVSRDVASQWFDDDEESEKDEGLKIWADWTVLSSKDLTGFSWVWVSVARPPGLQSSVQETTEAIKPASKVVAQLLTWEDAPNARTAAASSQLCASLDAKDMAGEILRIEAAPPQVSKSAVRSLRILPFAGAADRQSDGFRFGSKSRQDQQEAAQRLLMMYNTGKGYGRLFEGPITDGMLLPPDPTHEESSSWCGGIVKFHPPLGPSNDSARMTRGWLLGSDRRLVAATSHESPKSGPSDRRLNIEVSPDIISSSLPSGKWKMGEPLSQEPPLMVGVNAVVAQVLTHVRHSSSTLLTGGHGAGKTAMSQLIAHDMRRDMLAHIVYVPCQCLTTEETRVSTINDTVHRLFAMASWSARLGGISLVILDDIDTLCPAENELEIGNENSKNRHVSEIVRGAVQQHCTLNSRVCLLATAQSKEALHSVIIGGHVVREYVHLHAPDKDKRRQVLENFAVTDTSKIDGANGRDTSTLVDYLDIAGRTDGYMPGDLKLLVSRARSEALIRTLSAPSPTDAIPLQEEDFDAALKGFTPTSLRNVTLQHSSTSFSLIGGLKNTRQMLLETLQYPTLYAPIFANCPLRLRSGLLLYGFPGCGKTLLASAVAGECGLNFISVKGPEILNKYIGASEKSVRDLFERAQAARPCVLFFDEFDSVAPKRGHDSTGVTDRVVNQLLTQMDGAEGLSGVYVLAATSRPDLIDPALLRPGRLDKSLLCEMPNLEDREDITRALSSKLRMSKDAAGRLKNVAKETEGYTGADLQAVVYNAHLEAIHDAIGDRETHTKPRQDGAANSHREGASKGTIPDFTHFRMDEANGMPTSGAHEAAARSQIAQMLRAFKLTQQKARAARRESFVDGASADERDEAKDDGRDEPTIHWIHLERSLQQTRPSISPEEVRRLGRIYREFVASRSGEMPSGQGGSEIGGRSSLM